jgi:hypothetical protein
MSKEVYYRQCVLRKGNATTTSWIPEKFAEVGKVLKLKGDDESWDDDWVVHSVHARLPESQLPDYHADIKGFRKRSGDGEEKLQVP